MIRVWLNRSDARAVENQTSRNPVDGSPEAPDRHGCNLLQRSVRFGSGVWVARSIRLQQQSQNRLSLRKGDRWSVIRFVRTGSRLATAGSMGVLAFGVDGAVSG